MDARAQLEKAIAAIGSLPNADGGIPATRSGEESGAWTTASCLEALLESGHTPLSLHSVCHGMLKFLLEMQTPDGGWPLANSTESSTLATGHAVTALQLARTDLQSLTSAEKAAVDNAAARGTAWLIAHQNPDGGWGVQPSGGSDGSASRIAAVFYALRPFFYCGETAKSSQIVQRATTLLAGRQSHDGGWPFFNGDEVDKSSSVSNTARAVICLVHSGYSPSATAIREGLDFIASERLSGSSWRIGIEGFYATESNAQNIYHNNTPCDALEAFLVCGNRGRPTTEALTWLLNSQDRLGFWPLTSPDPDQVPRQHYSPGVTWCTSEFVHVVSMALRQHEGDSVVDRRRDSIADRIRSWTRRGFRARRP